MSPGSNIGTAPTTPGAIVVVAVSGAFVVVAIDAAAAGDDVPFISVSAAEGEDKTVRREGSIVGLGPAMLAMALLLLGFSLLVLLLSSLLAFFPVVTAATTLLSWFVFDAVVFDLVAA